MYSFYPQMIHLCGYFSSVLSFNVMSRISKFGGHFKITFFLCVCIPNNASTFYTSHSIVSSYVSFCVLFCIPVAKTTITFLSLISDTYRVWLLSETLGENSAYNTFILNGEQYPWWTVFECCYLLHRDTFYFKHLWGFITKQVHSWTCVCISTIFLGDRILYDIFSDIGHIFSKIAL